MNKPEITINLRRFRVALKSKETGEKATVFITLDKTQLQAKKSNEDSARYCNGGQIDRRGPQGPENRSQRRPS